MKEQPTQDLNSTNVVLDEEEEYSKWYGQIKFRTLMTYQRAKNIILQQEEDIIMEKWWQVNSGNKQPNWKMLFDSAQQCHSRSIDFKKSTNLLQSIAIPSYVLLKTMKLNANQLENVEFLIWLDAPHLVQIYLEDNLITTVRSLVKLKLKNPQNLHLTKNPLTEVDASRFYNKTVIEMTKLKLIQIFKLGSRYLSTISLRCFQQGTQTSISTWRKLSPEQISRNRHLRGDPQSEIQEEDQELEQLVRRWGRMARHQR